MEESATNDFLNRGGVGTKRWCIDARHPKGGYWQEVKATTNIHPTVKPLQLMSYLVTLGSREGDLVLDPFAGSGTTVVACRVLNRRFIGFEISEEYCKIAEARVGEAMAQRKLIEYEERTIPKEAQPIGTERP